MFVDDAKLKNARAFWPFCRERHPSKCADRKNGCVWQPLAAKERARFLFEFAVTAKGYGSVL
jgi:hypothetical protein